MPTAFMLYNRRRLVVLGLVSLTSLGCEDEVVIPASALSASSTPGGVPGAPAPGAPIAADPNAMEPPLPPVAFQEEDFSENDRSRDPFRSFQDLFLEKNDRKTFQGAKVLLENFSIDDLHLIGVITGIQPAKAMLVDPTGKGHVIQRNDLIGKAERVQSGGGGGEFEINWRVDRIRDSDVVFVREDPANPDVPSATRVLSLRTEEDDAQQ